MSACPGCYAGEAARAWIGSDPNTVFYALAAVLPFVLVAVLASLLDRLGRP